MDLQNFNYALTQVVHNFGAVTVVAAPLYMLIARPERQRKTLWLVLIGWCLQILSGVLFGGISLLYYGMLPDIRGVAILALLIKVLSAVSALGIIIMSLRAQPSWSWRRVTWMWRGLTVLGVVALTAAAFLRWYS